MSKADRPGGARVSPWTGQVFTSEFAYRDHMARWPGICEANGLELDGTPVAPARPKPAPAKARKK